MTKRNPLIPQNHIKGLIFDLDGTLANTMPLHIEAWKEAGIAYGVSITEKMINDRAGTPTIQVIQQLSDIFGWRINPSEFRTKKNELYQKLKQKSGKIKPIQSVLSIAKAYHKILPMAVGTGSIRVNAEIALKDMGIEQWFEVVVTADDVTAHKPDPATFIKCAEHLNLSPQECLVYEDGPMGIEAALAGGMSVVHIQTLEIFHP